MRTAIAITALLALAASAAAAERFSWSLPAGVDGEEVIARIRDADAWPELEYGAAVWKRPVLSGSLRVASSGRIDLTLNVPPDGDIEVLDRIIEHCCLAYRDERLPVLPALIERERMELNAAIGEGMGIRSEMAALLESGRGVVNRNKAVAASAERVEELRRRVVDARIETAVVEALIRGVRKLADVRRAKLRSSRQASAEDNLRYLLNIAGLGPNDPRVIAAKREIENQTRQPVPDDDQLTELVRRAVDLEVEQIVGEERVKILAAALEEERERGLGLLNATDLEEFRKNKLVPAEGRIRTRADKLAELEEELSAVRALSSARRVTADPATGEFPLVYMLGAVTNPGSYVIEGGTTTLTKLIALAGDGAAGCDLRAIKIVRREGERTRAITVNLTEVLSGELEDVVLQPNDMVFVPARR